MKYFCVIGHPIKHSLSPRIHNAWFKKKRIKANYKAVEVLPENLAIFMKNFREEFAGANVTIPHKQTVMKFLDWISPEARLIGAVNTIVNRKGKLCGYNTDIVGAMNALKKAGKVWTLTGKRVVVLGAGGAARAVVYGLVKAGACVRVLNRTPAHAKKLMNELGAKKSKNSYGKIVGSLEDFDPSDCDILINTTSVGMWPNIKDSPLPDFKVRMKKRANSHAEFPPWQGGRAKKMSKKVVVMDIIYRPRITKLLRDAQSAGCKIITGDHMFLAQAKKSFEYFCEVA